jgi:hypothetical protein
MEVSAYCSALETQLTGWKARIYDVLRVVDRLPNAQKETAFASIRNLHAIVDEINAELENLRTACPADWSPSRATIDRRMADLRDTLRRLSEQVKGPLIPDSLAWVSA